MEEKEFRRTMIMILVVVLIILSFLIVKPIILAVFFGLVLSYIFYPLFRKLNKKIKSKNLSALIIVLCLVIILLLPMVLLIPFLSREFVNFYLSIRNADPSFYIRELFPYLFESPTLAADIEAITSTFASTIASLISNTLKKIILNFPNILFQTIIILFTFFFALRDQKELKEYFLSISPFPKEYQNKFYLKFEQVTGSILYGQVVVGVIQGIVAGIGYFVFGVPNALLLMFLSMLAGVIPVIGPWLIWIPIDIYLFLTGKIGAGIGLLLYALLILNWIDALIRPQIVSRKTKMNSAVVLIGMIGGLYFFGVIGLILGPLIIAYLFLIIEFYKEKRFKSIIFKETNNYKK